MHEKQLILGNDRPCQIIAGSVVFYGQTFGGFSICSYSEEGPVKRTGALVEIISVDIRDLDGNLIEISDY